MFDDRATAPEARVNNTVGSNLADAGNVGLRVVSEYYDQRHNNNNNNDNYAAERRAAELLIPGLVVPGLLVPAVIELAPIGTNAVKGAVERYQQSRPHDQDNRPGSEPYRGAPEQVLYQSPGRETSSPQSLDVPPLWKEHVNPTAAEYRNRWVHDILDNGTYTVEKGDSLYNVARRSLGVSGHADAGAKEIAQEVKRIAALNDIQLDKKGHPVHHLQAGAVLDV
ncbi:MAG: LysM peptidoglycan-binding domain-containing protein [Cyanobacteria bacterium REEB67]|nr:LysM peptidoglycan-binding domain-containing protein [Cyanobacteria bacterium REEB67]